jgi:hypothetical protein
VVDLSFFLALSLYMGGTSLFDNYVSYRSLLTCSLFLFSLPLLPPLFFPSSRKYFYILGGLALLLALSRVSNPQSHPLPTASWEATAEVSPPTGIYRWNGPVFLQKMEKSCLLVSIYPRHEGGTSFLHTGWVNEGQLPSRFSTFSEYKVRATQEPIEMKNGVWNSICLCQKNSSDRQIALLQSDRGEYLTLSTTGKENRKDFFVSYGITPLQFFEWEAAPELAQKCQIRRVQE